MRIDRDAAAIVGDGQKAVGGKLDVDEGRVAGHRLVHRIVDHLGEEVMQRLLVGAADIHARTPAHRLQPLQHLDIGGVIALAAVLGLRAALGRRLQDRVERARGRAGRRGLFQMWRKGRCCRPCGYQFQVCESPAILPRLGLSITEVPVPFDEIRQRR